MRVAVAWPKPRAERWRFGQTRPDAFPDLSDGLLFLERHGIEVTIEESCGRWLNPLIDHHEFYSGLDPARAARIATRAARYDAAICVGDATAFVLLWIKRLFGLRLPIVLIDPALGDGYPRRRKLQDFVLPRVDRVVVYGRVQLDYLRDRYGNTVRAAFLHHRADTSFYQPPHEGAPREPFVFSIGNDISRDFRTLAHAAGALNSRGRAAAIVVQTTMSIDDPRQALTVQPNRLSYDDLRRTYQRAGVVVVPLGNSRHPGGINAILEAMAAGAPLVVSGSEGILDYVEHEVSALVVPPGDPVALAAALQRLLDDRSLANRLAASARQFVVERCSNAVYAAQLAGVLRQATDGVRGVR